MASRGIQACSITTIDLRRVDLKYLNSALHSIIRCKVLCDQLYMNAMLRRHDVCLDDLGTAFNMPGTQVNETG